MRKEIQAAGTRASADAKKSKAIAEYNENPKRCLQCGAVIELNGKKPAIARRKTFCSHGCAGRYTNQKFPKRRPEGECDTCGNPIRACLKYCSDNCRAKARQRRTVEQVKAGNIQAVIGWRIRTKDKAVEYKGGKCCRCEYERCTRALEFHHIDPSKKDFAVSRVSKSWAVIQSELDKCILLCANCHREFHDGMWKIEDLIVVPPLVGSV